jgi:protein-S-isoprenylcysteine O-methyltransferase Ste14
MGATKIEFRLRMVIMAVIITLGFWAPWIAGRGIGQRIPLFAWLALTLHRLGLVSFSVATPMVIGLGALIAAAGAVLRIWGTAYLGSTTVRDGQMRAGLLIAGGPYRYARNPLYLGLWLTLAALAFLMPITGALLAMVLITVFQLRLIFGEEAFLAGQLGEPYMNYLRTVPRLFPRLRSVLWFTGIQPTGLKPQWFRSVLAELNPIGVFVTLAFLSWSYDTRLMVRAIVISFGVSLVVRALMPNPHQQAAPAE